MVNSINGSSSWANFQMQMNTNAVQKHQDEMFNKIDSNSDGGIDKMEFSALAKKMSAIAGISSNSSPDTGTTQSVDDVFSTYDTNGDAKLSQDELGSYMEANRPFPPPDAIGGFMGTMNTQEMQKHQDEMFCKLDSNSDGSIDKTELASLAKNISEDTGNTLDVDSVFSTYDTDGDSQLSKDELNSYMEANRPPMPMKNATSAYSANSSTDKISSLLEYLTNQAATEADQATTMNDFISNLLELLNNKTGHGDNDFLMDVIT